MQSIDALLTSHTSTGKESVDKQDKGKLIISAAKSLKGYRIADPRIASFLYGTLEAGRLGLFASAIKSEEQANIKRIQFLAAQEGIGLPTLTTELLPWLEGAGLCQLKRQANGDIGEVTSLVLAYQDLLGAVSDFYDSKNPSNEDRACLIVLAQSDELPGPESVIRHTVANEFGEETANTALHLAKAYGIVGSSGSSSTPLLYGPRVWARLLPKASKALAPLDSTDREILIHLINRVRQNQGYPETLLMGEANRNGAAHLVDMAIGIALVNRTEIHMADGTKRAFLTTPHLYSDLADEFGEDMCDRVKIFLDSIRNGQYFGSRSTGKIFDPELLLRALLNTGHVGPATAIGTDYMVAEKAGIIRVQRASAGSRPLMELGQEDTVRKVLEVVSSGSMEPGRPPMDANHLSDGTDFRSIEQGRAELGGVSGEQSELEYEIMKNLREG